MSQVCISTAAAIPALRDAGWCLEFTSVDIIISHGRVRRSLPLIDKIGSLVDASLVKRLLVEIQNRKQR